MANESYENIEKLKLKYKFRHPPTDAENKEFEDKPKTMLHFSKKDFSHIVSFNRLKIIAVLKKMSIN